MLRPHDLVLCASVAALSAPDGSPLTPDAVAAARLGSPGAEGAWLVVRRAPAEPGTVPVGIRGARRSERYAARLPMDAIAQVVPPASVAFAPAPERAALPAFAALSSLRAILSADGWGPGGSVGFELVTGYPAVTPTSDLDLIIDAPQPLSRSASAVLLGRVQSGACRIDVQLVTPWGGVALAEWAGADGRLVALRTAEGPRLVRDPWCGA